MIIKHIAGRFNLNEINETHLDYLFGLRNSPVKMWFFDDRVIEWEQHLNWYESYKKSDDLMFVIEDTKNSTLIGTVCVKKHTSPGKAAEFGRFCIGDPSYIKKGYAPLILQSLFHAVFSETETEKITSAVFNLNKVISLYTQLGFIVCGFDERYTCYPGKVISVVSMVLPKERFYDNYRF